MGLQMNDDYSLISALYFPGCPGRIYLEGRDPGKVWQACSLVPEVRKMKSMVLIPGFALSQFRSDRIRAQTWARLQKGPNKTDLAYVLRADVDSDHVQIAVVPRMAFTVQRSPEDNLCKLERLPAIPFDPTIIEDVHGPDALKQRGDSCIFDNKTFRNGMLILNVQALHTLVPIPFPSLREVMPFVDAGFIAYEAALDVTAHEELARIRPGDYVHLIAGQRAGCMAMVVTIEDYIACVDIHPVDMDPDQPSNLVDVPIYSMQRILHVGDYVRVRDDAAELAGSAGIIAAVSEDGQVVQFIQEKTKKTVNFS
jgi:hypothetical protein